MKSFEPIQNKFSIKKVAVLGAGIMGSRIACHFANIGVEVLLLDISPKQLTEEESKKGLALDHPLIKNKIVQEAFQHTLKSKPAALYTKELQKRIQVGNFEDDMPLIATCDWIIEVVVERLDIKKKIFDQVEQYRKEGTLVSSNTSGIPIHLMLDGRSEDFKKHFCGTHFFNPPRYLPLLEIIPTASTDLAVIEFLLYYGDLHLGKKTVLCKDTPAFIANRIGIFAIMDALHVIEEQGWAVEEVDALTGTLIGRPKSATFRTLDVVGLDTVIHVANNLYAALPEDEARAVFQLPEVIKKLQEKNWLGDKTQQGFYKKIKDDKAKSNILALDFNTLEYHEKNKVQFNDIQDIKSEDNVKKRLHLLLTSKSRSAQFIQRLYAGIFAYVSHRVPEISDDIYKIDDAMKAGFGWEFGPFETWDIIGLQKGLELIRQYDLTAAAWVDEMMKKGISSFYEIKDQRLHYYNLLKQDFTLQPGLEGLILLKYLNNKVIWENSGSSIYDLGEGIMGLELHSKMNTLGPEVIQGINHAINWAEKEFQGLVISGRGANFSAGANLGVLFMHAIEQEWDEINWMIAQFQNTIMRVRYSSIPVVTAVSGLALGGGCELNLHADHIQAHAETYMGLVELGVGVIPAGGGTKEMALRVSDAYQPGDTELNDLQTAFMNIAQAKVSTSAHEARNLNYIRKKDGITINKDRILTDAKMKALDMALSGYQAPLERKDIKVQGKAGIALFMAGIYAMLSGKYISEHDAKVAEKLAYVICGGALSQATQVTERYLLDLEREAFLSLCGEKKTLERMQSVLTKGKPIRN